MKASPIIKHIIEPRIESLGEFNVRRLLPSRKQRMVGPWVFFDHMEPATFQPGPGVNVRPHPHINLATVTYLFEGEVLHRDSLGCVQAINPGDINLMVAGSGIVHSERERKAATGKVRRLHGLQLWLALPEADEETPPEFLHYPSADIPLTTVNDVPVRVMIGTAFGLTSPVKTFSSTLYAEAKLDTGHSIAIPSGMDEIAIYVAAGSLEIDGVEIPEFSLAILNVQSNAELIARKDSQIAFIGGGKVGSRHVWWNFVSSRKERIEQAKKDWAEGRFKKVPGDEVEFIPLPD